MPYRAHLATTFLAASLASAAAGQTPTWRAELLEGPDGPWSPVAVSAVSDAGLTIGFTYVSGYKHGWFAAPGQPMELLPLPPGANWSDPLDVNADGVIAGSVLIGGASRGAVWRPGPAGYEALLLPAGPGGFPPTDARGVNDLGEVVGKLGPLSGSYVWSEAAGLTQLTTAEFPVVPEDINEQRQIVGDRFRMDLDTMVLEDLGAPAGAMYAKLYSINDAGECAGYAVAATSENPYLAVRYTDGAGWKQFNLFPVSSANAMSIAASGDVTYQLGAVFGDYVYVEGYGSIGLESTLDAASASFDLSGSHAPFMSRGGRIACNGLDTATGEAGIVLLTPSDFGDLGGAATGALGDPLLGGYGPLTAGAPARLRLASAAPGSVAVVAWSATSTPVPLFGGVFHATPTSFFVTLPTDSLGRFDVTFAWPSVLPGTPFYQQAAVLDAASALGVSMSNGLQGATQ